MVDEPCVRGGAAPVAAQLTLEEDPENRAATTPLFHGGSPRSLFRRLWNIHDELTSAPLASGHPGISVERLVGARENFMERIRQECQYGTVGTSGGKMYFHGGTDGAVDSAAGPRRASTPSAATGGPMRGGISGTGKLHASAPASPQSDPSVDRAGGVSAKRSPLQEDAAPAPGMPTDPRLGGAAPWDRHLLPNAPAPAEVTARSDVAEGAQGRVPAGTAPSEPRPPVSVAQVHPRYLFESEYRAAVDLGNNIAAQVGEYTKELGKIRPTAALSSLDVIHQSIPNDVRSIDVSIDRACSEAEAAHAAYSALTCAKIRCQVQEEMDCLAEKLQYGSVLQQLPASTAIPDLASASAHQ